MERYYSIAPSRIDWALWFVEGAVFFIGVVVAFRGEWLAALVLFVVSTSIMLKFQERGVFIKKPLLELTGSELMFRQPFYVPTKVQNIELNGIRKISIVGPYGDRRFQFFYADGSRIEVRPFLRGAEQGAIEFLKNNLSHVEIDEKSPPGMFDVIRGDY